MREEEESHAVHPEISQEAVHELVLMKFWRIVLFIGFTEGNISQWDLIKSQVSNKSIVGKENFCLIKYTFSTEISNIL
jgi:WD40 repeat protein